MPKKPDPDRQILNGVEAAWYLGLSWNTLRVLFRNGDIPGRKVSHNKHLFHKADLDDYVRQKNDRVALARRILHSV